MQNVVSKLLAPFVDIKYQPMILEKNDKEMSLHEFENQTFSDVNLTYVKKDFLRSYKIIVKKYSDSEFIINLSNGHKSRKTYSQFNRDVGKVQP